MAASKTQGSYLAVFWTACTVLCAGLAYFAEGFGKLVLLIGLAGVVISLVGFLKIKPLEGKTAGPATIASLKILGIAVALGGWFVTIAGLHLTTSVGGRTDLRFGRHRREPRRGPWRITGSLWQERGRESAIFKFYRSQNHYGA